MFSTYRAHRQSRSLGRVMADRVYWSAFSSAIITFVTYAVAR